MPRPPPWRDQPIGRKLLLTALLVTGVMLAALSLLALAKEIADWRDRSVSELTADSEIISASVAPAVAARDPRAAAGALSALAGEPDMLFGAVYDDQGRRLAAYGPPTAGPERLTAPPPRAVHRFHGVTLTLTRPIVRDGRHIGSLYLKSDLGDVYADLATDALVDLLAAAAAFGVAALLFRRLQRDIVGPVVELSAAMQGVSRSQDYAVRVAPRSGDEVGALAAGFNAMLEAVQERDVRLAEHSATLEDTVRARTAELKDANGRLEVELTERKAAQAALHAHDSMLKAVARSAESLLESLNIEDAVSSVLELMGQTLAVARAQLSTVAAGPDGHLRSAIQHEWAAPGLAPMLDDPALRDLDLTAQMPAMITPTLLGEQTALALDQLPEPARQAFARAGMRSMLFVPVMAEGRLSGGLWFMDCAATGRAWSWAETDTLATLASLIGVSTTRARYVKELADANTIVQNSPTVLYRLKGEPPLPLTYVSHNITKFGYDPKALVASPDYVETLVHPDDRQRVLEAMDSVLERNAQASTIEFRLMLPSGGFRWVENRYTPVRDEAGRLVEVEGIIIDITERKAAEERIALLARTDGLTGLANRSTFVERLHQAFVATKRGAPAFAVLYLDLDHFKDVNDTRGHPVGDRLLCAAGERLKSLLRESDLVARLGGDEFAVLQMDVADPSDAGALAAKIRQALGEPYPIDGALLRVSASIGISPFAPETAGPDAMLTQADLALYRAKEEGRNQYRFHTEDLDRQVNERVVMAEELRQAVERDELFLQFQPQVELQGGRIVGMEALVRWNHPRRGVLAPADFLSIAEKTGTSQALGHWVLEHACRQMKLWREAGVAPPAISVNLSMNQLKTGGELVREVADILARNGLEAHALELDVTESMLAKVTLAQNDVLDRLERMGVRIALDDFGTEYSSFDYLRTYRVDHLKVAREFIENAASDPHRAATVRAIIGAARELGIQVIAEGVETEDQRALVLAIGPTATGQGFLFSEAVAADRATELLRKGAIEPAEPAAA